MIKNGLPVLFLLLAVALAHAQYPESFSTLNKDYAVTTVNDFAGIASTGWASGMNSGVGTDDDFWASQVAGGAVSPPTCMIDGPDFVCNNSAGIVYTAPAGMSGYSWGIIGDGSISGSTTGQSITVTSGNYLNNYTVSVTITDGIGGTSSCSKVSNIFLAKPPANITANPSEICLGATLDLSIAAAASSTISWTGEGIANPAGNPSTTATPTSSGPHTYGVTVTTDQGCSNTGTVSVGVNPLPVCSINGPGGSNDTLCQGSQYVFTAAPGMSAYNWGVSPNGAIIGSNTGSSVTITPNSSSSLVVFVTITDAKGCTSTCTQFRPLNTAPTCSMDGPLTVCGGSTGNVYTVTTNGTLYYWSISGDGVITSPASGSPSVTVTAGASGSYTVSVGTQFNYNTCVRTCSQTVTVNTAPAPAITGPVSVCPDGSATLDAGAGYTSYAWSNGGGNAQTATFNNLLATTTYTVTVTGANGCTGTGTFTVNVASCTVDFSGKIVWENNDTTGVKDAIVNLAGSANGSDVTDVNGEFSIMTGVPSGSFTLKPVKNLNKLNGVTTADASAIQQHVAAILPITDPYKLVCADVNKSNSVTSLDASIIIQAVLGNPAALNQFKTSWRFVPSSHVMQNPPWGFPEQRTYTNISGLQANQNFIGMKTGDVTGSANPANLGAPEPLMLRADDRVLSAGEQISVDFAADKKAGLAAFQYALRFDPLALEFVSIEPLTALPLTTDNFGLFNVEDGEIRVAWAQPTGVDVEASAPIFRVHFNALAPGVLLSDVLKIDPGVLPGLAYTSALEEMAVELQYGLVTGTNTPGMADFALLQNRPNPFNGTTTIGFVLPAACEARLRIVDVSGRVITERTAQYPAGTHAELFELDGASGVLYYELITPFGTQTKRMLVSRK